MSALMTVPVAGLQYYAYHRDDGMGGRVEPRQGDPITLVREPGNRHDPNAVQVWWHNGYQLGHLAREDAVDLAPLMDRGLGVVARVADPGRGRAWSMRVALSGPAIDQIVAGESAPVDQSGWVPWPPGEDCPF